MKRHLDKSNSNIASERAAEEEAASGGNILLDCAMRMIQASPSRRRRSRSSTDSQTSDEELSSRERKANFIPILLPPALPVEPWPQLSLATPPRPHLQTPGVSESLVSSSPTSSSPTSQYWNDERIFTVNKWLADGVEKLQLSPKSRTVKNRDFSEPKRGKTDTFSRLSSERASGGKAAAHDDSGTFRRQGSERASGGKAMDHGALSRQSSERSSGDRPAWNAGTGIQPWHTEDNLWNTRCRIPVGLTGHLPPAFPSAPKSDCPPQSATKSTGAIPKVRKCPPAPFGNNYQLARQSSSPESDCSQDVSSQPSTSNQLIQRQVMMERMRLDVQRACQSFSNSDSAMSRSRSSSPSMPSSLSEFFGW